MFGDRNNSIKRMDINKNRYNSFMPIFLLLDTLQEIYESKIKTSLLKWDGTFLTSQMLFSLLQATYLQTILTKFLRRQHAWRVKTCPVKHRLSLPELTPFTGQDEFPPTSCGHYKFQLIYYLKNEPEANIYKASRHERNFLANRNARLSIITCVITLNCYIVEGKFLIHSYGEKVLHKGFSETICVIRSNGNIFHPASQSLG